MLIEVKLVTKVLTHSCLEHLDTITIGIEIGRYILGDLRMPHGQRVDPAMLTKQTKDLYRISGRL